MSAPELTITDAKRIRLSLRTQHAALDLPNCRFIRPDQIIE